MSDIKLRNADQPEEKVLPIGVRVITFDGVAIFARYDRISRRFVPVSAQEQIELCQQFRL